MTDRELFIKALDALEKMKAHSYLRLDYAEEAINALRDRLAQPERRWVGLTEPERLACYDLNPTRFASAIENLLKEKNT